MLRDPVGEWRELSALYEQAELLQGRALQDWLANLRTESHPLVADLDRMLAAKARAAQEGFLSTLPTLADAGEHLPAEWSEGSRIGAYRLVRHIGSGGMAEVWLADRVDGAFERQVAIKLLFDHPGRSRRDSFAERFRRERDILASLDHPNIARLHDAGVTPSGQPWLALEYVEGVAITSWCDQNRLGLRSRLDVFRQVLLAVEHAHANLIIHRDLKPSNILVTRDGEVRLLDFGIAKLLERDGDTALDSDLTRASGRPLTPQYASPEQLVGRPLTTASDTYSLGVIFYELMVGQTPYEVKSASAASLEMSIIEVEPRPMSRRALTSEAASSRHAEPGTLRAMMRPDLDAIALCALHKSPAGRYASVGAFRADVDCWLQGKPVLATDLGAFYRFGKFIRRHRIPVASAVLVVLALSITGSVAVLQGLKAQQEGARAVASKDFVLSILRQSDPNQTKGSDVTAGELLDAGLAQANQSLSAQPEMRVEVLNRLAEINQNLGRYTSAHAIFLQAADVFATLGRSRDWALVQIHLAENALQMGDERLANAMLQNAQPAALKHATDHQLQTRYHEVAGWLARSRGDLPAAKKHMLSSWNHALIAYGRNDNRAANAVRGLAWVEEQLGEYDLAREHIETAVSIAASSTNANANDLIGIEIERARIEFGAGRLDRAKPLISAAIGQCDGSIGEQNENCCYLRILQTLLLMETGSHREALVFLPPLLREASNQFSPRRQAEAALVTARLLAANGQLGEHPYLRAKLHDLSERQAVQNLSEGTMKSARLALAEIAVRERRPEEARRLLRTLMESHEKLGQEGRAYLARAHLLQGLALQLQGAHAEALGSLKVADENYARAFGVGHTSGLIYRLNQVPSLLALGEREAARLLIRRTLPVLQERLPPGSPVVAVIDSASRELDMSTRDIPPSAGHAVFLE